MKMKVVFESGSWFIGDRNWKTQIDECWGTHHFKVLQGSLEFEEYIGKEIAVAINKPKFFVLNEK